MIEQINLGLDDVARFWGTPRPLLMLDTNSHYNDYQNATMEVPAKNHRTGEDGDGKGDIPQTAGHGILREPTHTYLRETAAFDGS